MSRDWRDYLPTHKERGRYRGAFSIYTEYHAFVLGLGAGTLAVLLGQTEIATIAIAIALGVEGVGRFTGEGVMTELSLEPWYAIAGVLLGVGLGHIVAAAGVTAP